MEQLRNFKLSEDFINAVAYNFLRIDKILQANKLFLFNATFFPSYNSWDSWGEGSLAAGKREESIMVLNLQYI